MPKKNCKFELPKKKKKNKPKPPDEGAKRDEEEKTGMEDKEDQDEGSSSSDTASSRHEKSSAEVEKPVGAGEGPQVGESAAKFKQVEIPGKGQGLVATARLPVGTIVIQESPIFTAKETLSLFNHDVKEIVAKFRRLTEEQKNEVLSLYDPGPTSQRGRILASSHPAFADETEEKACRIFAGNSLGLCHREGTIDMSALYKTISRINHSCAPNVVWSWILGDKSKVAKQVRVVREIKEGEEILVRYWGANSFSSKDERQKRLRIWNFNCNCEVCSFTGDKLIENEKVRKKIRDLQAGMDIKSQLGFPKQAYEAAKEKLKIMRSIEKEMVVDLPTALVECCLLASVCGLPSSSTAELMKKAKDMSKLFGDSHVHNYMGAKEQITVPLSNFRMEMNRLMRGDWM